MITLMTNIVQFAYWNVQKKRKMMTVESAEGPTKVPATHMYKYRPVYILIFASFLVCTQPVCMLIIGSWSCDGNFTSDQIDTSSLTYNPKTRTYDDSSGPVGMYAPDGSFELVKLVNKTVVPSTERPGSSLVTFATDVAYPDGCSPSMHNFFFDGGDSNYINPNTTVGWMIQIFGTYCGFIFMFIGVCQATLLHVKVMQKWNTLRAPRDSDSEGSQI